MLRQIQGGDVAAFEQLFRRAAPGLVVFVARVVESRAIAEEVVQDVLFRFWERRAGIEIRGSLMGYLYAAARHAAIDYRRVVSAEQRLCAAGGLVTTGPYSIGGLRELGVAPTGEVDVREAELAAALRRAVERLPARRREIFVLHRSRGLTYPQIAGRLGISVKTVETQIGRALVAVRDVLRPYL